MKLTDEELQALVQYFELLIELDIDQKQIQNRCKKGSIFRPLAVL